MAEQGRLVAELGAEERGRRVGIIDAWRGVAVLLVVFYHYIYRWTEGAFAGHSGVAVGFLASPPWGLAELMPIKYGYVGVQLFFVISGFVIGLTIGACTNWVQYAGKRFARIFPALWSAAAITAAIILLGLAPPAFDLPNWRSVFPTMTTLPPVLLQPFLGPTKYVDGVYWTLFVELRFYFLAGLVYFVRPDTFFRNFIVSAFAITGAVLVVDSLALTHLSAVLRLLTAAYHLPLFALGLVMHRHYSGALDARRYAYLVLGLISAWGIALWARATPELGATLVEFAFVALLVCCFIFTVNMAGGREMFFVKILASIGVRSYAIYLLHQVVGVTLIWRLASFGMPWFWQISITLAAIGCISSIFYSLVERKLGSRASYWISRLVASRAG